MRQCKITKINNIHTYKQTKSIQTSFSHLNITFTLSMVCLTLRDRSQAQLSYHLSRNIKIKQDELLMF